MIPSCAATPCGPCGSCCTTSTSASLPSYPDQRTAQYQALREHIRVLAQENWPRERIMRLAALASQFDAPEEAPAELSTTGARKPGRNSAVLRQSGPEALSWEITKAVPSSYLAKRASTAQTQQARHYYELAIRTLQAGNKPQAALAWPSGGIGPLSDDIATLYVLTGIGPAGRPDIAEHYVRRLLHLAPSLQWQHWRRTPLLPSRCSGV